MEDFFKSLTRSQLQALMIAARNRINELDLELIEAGDFPRLDEHEIELLCLGRKISAIKRYRARVATPTLLYAKRAVEKTAKIMGIDRSLCVF